MIVRDRFLMAILVGSLLMAALALGLYFTRLGPPGYTSDASPTGVFQNFYTALQRREYPKAYSYVAGPPGPAPDGLGTLPTLSEFTQFFENQDQSGNLASVGMQITPVQPSTGSTWATLDVVVLRDQGPSLFRSVYREEAKAELVYQNGAWKILRAPYPFWGYDWTGPYPAKPIPAQPANTPPIPTPTAN
jgi:hypothetical protein